MDIASMRKPFVTIRKSKKKGRDLYKSPTSLGFGDVENVFLNPRLISLYDKGLPKVGVPLCLLLPGLLEIP